MKKILLTSLFLSSLYVSAQASHAEKFTLAILGDPQFNWTCASEGTTNAERSDYCKNKGKVKNEAEDSNNKAISEIKKIKESVENNYKGMIINGDLTQYGHPEERERFQKFYKIKDSELKIYPALGNHDYQNNINDCGAKYTQGWNKCAGGMMHLMADWILGYKGLDKGEPHGCNPLLKSCDIYAFNKNRAQTTGNRNVIGSLAYSWELDKFLFIQLQNYPHYTTDFKRGWDSGVSSWTMKAQNSMPWLITQLDDAKTNNQYVILNLHNIEYYFGRGVKDDDKEEKARRELARGELESVLNRYKPNIRAIFVGHYHQEIGKDISNGLATQIAGIPILYSGSPISGRFLKVEFNASNPKECIKLSKVNTINGNTEPAGEIECPSLK